MINNFGKAIENYVIEKNKDEEWSVSIESFNNGVFKMVFPSDLDAPDENAVLDWLKEMEMSTIESFIGYCFHLIQQCGGELFYNGKRLRVIELGQTSGFPMSRENRLYLEDKIVKFGDL